LIGKIPAALLAVAFISSIQISARQIEAPTLVPVPSTPQQAAKIRDGIALHDKGDYDGAIEKYEQVLDENPDNALVLYELALTYETRKDFRRCLETAYRGAKYKSDHLSGFYMLIGNVLDTTGDPKKAVEVYKRAIQVSPDDALVHYNLAVTLKNLNRHDDAKKSLKAALMLDPKHPSSHLLLASILWQTGYRTPAFFPAARFLTLEPKTERAGVALRIVRDVLGAGVTRTGENSITIPFSTDTKKDEGDFSAVEMFLGLTQVASMSEKNKGKTETQVRIEQFGSLLSLLGEQTDRKKQSAFIFTYYVPYFVELKQRGHLEPFVRYTHQRVLEGSGRWVEEHSGQVLQFLSWSKNFKWHESGN
jgi:Tfp pilus assembly protein PilF